MRFKARDRAAAQKAYEEAPWGTKQSLIRKPATAHHDDQVRTHLVVACRHTHLLLRREKPEVVGLQEVAPRWTRLNDRSETVRVADTHLEPVVQPIRNAQGNELRTALARSPYPVAAVGDFDSLPTDATGPYGTFTLGGYDDARRAVHGPGDGFTAQQDPERTPGGLWPSDHAGATASLRLRRS